MGQREIKIGIDAVERAAAYRPPEMKMISDGGTARALYKAEADRNEVIGRCAREWANLMDPESETGKGYWNNAIPQALYDVLSAYDSVGALVAAEAFLQTHGWQVTRPGKEYGCPVCTQQLKLVDGKLEGVPT